MSLQVSDASIFSFDSTLSVGGGIPGSLETQRQLSDVLSDVLTLQFGQQYNLFVFVGSNSRAAQREVPEPATSVLLVSGLGFMAGVVKKQRPGV